jgi:hypothetical protein
LPVALVNPLTDPYQQSQNGRRQKANVAEVQNQVYPLGLLNHGHDGFLEGFNVLLFEDFLVSKTDYSSVSGVVYSYARFNYCHLNLQKQQNSTGILSPNAADVKFFEYQLERVMSIFSSLQSHKFRRMCRKAADTPGMNFKDDAKEKIKS